MLPPLTKYSVQTGISLVMTQTDCLHISLHTFLAQIGYQKHLIIYLAGWGKSNLLVMVLQDPTKLNTSLQAGSVTPPPIIMVYLQAHISLLRGSFVLQHLLA